MLKRSDQCPFLRKGPLRASVTSSVVCRTDALAELESSGGALGRGFDGKRSVPCPGTRAVGGHMLAADTCHWLVPSPNENLYRRTFCLPFLLVRINRFIV